MAIWRNCSRYSTNSNTISSTVYRNNHLSYNPLLRGWQNYYFCGKYELDLLKGFKFRLLFIIWCAAFSGYAESGIISETHTVHVKSLDEYESTVEAIGVNTGGTMTFGVACSEMSELLSLELFVWKGDKWKKINNPDLITSTIDYSSFFSGTRKYILSTSETGKFRVLASFKEKHTIFLTRLFKTGWYEAEEVSYHFDLPSDLNLTTEKGSVYSGSFSIAGSALEEDAVSYLIHPADQKPVDYFVGWFEERLWPQLEFDKSLLPDTLRMLNGEEDPLKIAGACFRFVQKQIRYVDIENGINAVIPRKCEQVLEKRIGDCKDMATLLTALCRSFGVEAYPAISRTNGKEGVFDFPSVGEANHMICAVQLKDDWYFLDATEEFCLFGDPSVQIMGTEVLLIGHPELDFLQVPPIPGSYTHGSLSCMMDRERGIVSMDILSHGKMNLFLRYLNTKEHEPRKNLEKLFKSLTGKTWKCEEMESSDSVSHVRLTTTMGLSTYSKVGQKALYDVSFLPSMKVLSYLFFGKEYPSYAGKLDVEMAVSGQVAPDQFLDVTNEYFRVNIEGGKLRIELDFPALQKAESFGEHPLQHAWKTFVSKPITVYEE